MGECTDKRFRDLIHLYELDILPPEEKEAFELHLYECQECFEAVRQFREETLILRHDPDLHETVKESSAIRLPEEEAPETREARSRRLPVLAALAAIFVVVILILKPWHIEIAPQKEAVAVPNRLAVMHFTAVTGEPADENLGEIAANLLIADLSESQYIQVVSSQRLHDILTMLGYTSAQVPDRDVATRIAEKAHARWMLIGTILQEHPFLIITAELTDVATGTVVDAARVSGEPGQSIFALVDQLSVQVKEALSLPVAARDEYDPRVAEVTTASPEAYRHYLSGINNNAKYFTDDAIADFKRAVSADSTFAAAYYYLALLKDRRYIDQAMKYLDRAGQKEQHYIRSLHAAIAGNTEQAVRELEELVSRYPDEKYALFRLGQYSYALSRYEEAVTYLNRAIAADSLYKLAYNYLAYAYDRLGDLEQSILAINKYIDLVPDEPNPYDSRGDLYAANGELSKAIESYRKALERKPDYAPSIEKLGHMHLFAHEYATADSLYRKLATHEQVGFHEAGRFYLSLIPATRGTFSAALSLLDSLITVGGTMPPDSAPPLLFRAKGRIFLELGECDSAITYVELSDAVHRNRYPHYVLHVRDFYAFFLAECGQVDSARAVAENVKRDFEDANISLDTYWLIAGYIALAEGNLDTAIDLLEKSAASSRNALAHYPLGRAYLEAGMLSKAVAKFEQQLANFSGTGWRMCMPIWNVSLHYYLGIAYEKSGWNDRAVEQYETFLEIWRDADPDLTLIDDARLRLARLKSHS